MSIKKKATLSTIVFVLTIVILGSIQYWEISRVFGVWNNYQDLQLLR